MIIEYYISQSTARPETIDTTSSKKYNYVRKNITEITNEDGAVMYEYEEAKIAKEDWDEYYDSIMKDLEIAELKAINAKMESDVTDLQNAIVEIYETLLM